jgi:2-dehydrotetronate isomerase
MKFAANLSMMFTELDFPERFVAASDAGFKGVEYLFPYAFDANDLKRRLDGNGLQQVLFNLPPGDWDAGERGLASLTGREAQFYESVATATTCANILKPARVHCMAGMRQTDVDARQQRATYAGNLVHAATAFHEAGIELLIEPINPHDMPGYYLNDFGLALEIITEVNRISSFPIGLQFDIYHCQRIHGDVPHWLERCRGHTRHLQIAGTPGRHEPDLGDLPLDAILEVVDTLHPDLWIGCEYRPAGRTLDGLGWMKRWH